jgi:histidinol-phosphatase (PHP family)
MRAEDLPAYCGEVRHLREANRGRLRVHLSLEFDYIPERLPALWALIAPFTFDYLIGSVHFVGLDAAGAPWPYDLTRRGFERGLSTLYDNNIRRLVGAYYERVRSLAAWGRSAIVGHIDRIKMWNRNSEYFSEDEDWYRREVSATLKACARTGVIVEFNTTGWRHAARSPYPSPWVLRRCLKMDIPIVVTTDAHTPSRVTESHDRAEALLREVGCSSLAVLRGGVWRAEPV